MTIASKNTTLKLTTLAAAILALSACGGSDNPAPPPPAQVAKTCTELNGLTIAAASIGLPTTGAVVTSTVLVPAAGTGVAAVAEYCKVLGDINPVDTNAPKIKFQVNLPVNWNSKAMMFGGGGYNGVIATGAGNVPAGPIDKPTPLARGYATFGSDSGHQANANGSRDGTFGANDEALKNFSSDALKKTRDAAITIIQARYADTVKKTYFAGGSTGGREALIAVQNWPQDFDGAIVLYPAWNAASLDLQFGRITRELAKPGAYPSRAKRKVLYDASLAACDALDGVTDGLISNVKACNASFDPATATLNGTPIRCVGGADTGDTCLSDAQITAFNVTNTPLALNYALASGETTYPGFNTWGTDFGIPGTSPLQPTVLTLSLGTEQPANPMPLITATTSPPYGSTFWDQWVRFFVTRDPTFNSLSLDPQNPGSLQARIVELTGIQDLNKSDLSAFQAKGGKILMAHGSHDALVSTRATEQYWDRIRNTMGAAKVDSFARYYEIPGYGHAVSSVFNASWDSLTTLENWVEKGAAPPNQVVADTAGVPGRTRPLCDYPSWAKYKGAGDINVAPSYACVTQ
ncbi:MULTISPECIES: tannase/feruloyl esterase family alpha/beta hydrolase [unclassified Polaromonas]|uniref:tannase/feruloyl esterase family alpha/beta hydrolase n=1 Tax=unclassified Polaromonas TaxID=2638319 RepID=UPI0018C91260|nr:MULTISPECIES: tannase/feruloyl esterase family alpha/beta hydrolase [unclassified Polaromonas]MBG6071311.1 feruloyl esterase [Polaromonas sp. CG_9.7]MBG6113311.1 feruloyl esterase [Polaromonas sp. CG_9.2]MDH6183234.1 feruloyl esterase [Polaromonas sp. CG_23.6]